VARGDESKKVSGRTILRSDAARADDSAEQTGPGDPRRLPGPVEERAQAPRAYLAARDPCTSADCPGDLG